MKEAPLSLYRADNGWVVAYRCVTLVFSGDDVAKLGVELCAFIKDPDAVIEHYQKKYRGSDQLVPTLDGPPAPTAGLAAIREGGLPRFVERGEYRINRPDEAPF